MDKAKEKIQKALDIVKKGDEYMGRT